MVEYVPIVIVEAHTMPRYTYPDINDVITATFVEKYFGVERWYKEEEIMLNIVKAELKKRDGINLAVDIGTGQGRLVPWILSFSKRVVALDLDIIRLIIAKRVNHSLNTSCLLGDGCFIPLKNSCADFVLLSHVIQHIPTYKLPELLTELRRILRNHGNALIMSTHSTDLKKERYLLVQKGLEWEVGIDKFNLIKLLKPTL